MPDYSFGLIVAGADFSQDDIVNSLYEAGIEDASFARRDGASVAYFDRESESFLEALVSAVRDLEAAVPDLKVCGVEGANLLTASGVAERSGRSRQNVHQHIRGTRGMGFPDVVFWVDDDRPVWLSGDIDRWTHDHAPESRDQMSAAAGAAFHLARASCSLDGPSFDELFDFVVERTLSLSDDPEDRSLQLSKSLRLMAERLERRESPL